MQTQENKNQISFSSVAYMYLSMFVVASGLIIWWQENQHELFLFNWQDVVSKEYFLVVGLSLGVLLVGNYLLNSWLSPFRGMQNIVMALLSNFSLKEMFFAAFLASIAEEMLFRGALLPSLGLVGSSILFALIHLSMDEKAPYWMLWAFICGLLLGAVTLYCKTIYPAMMIHFCYNFILMNIMAKKWKKLSKSEQTEIMKSLEVAEIE